MGAQITRREFLLGRSSGHPVARVLEGCFEPRGIVCGSCRDACPEGAVRIVPMAGGVSHPLIDPAACTGCGDCAAACPATAIALA